MDGKRARYKGVCIRRKLKLWVVAEIASRSERSRSSLSIVSNE